MSAHKMHLEPVDLGSGLVATDAWIAEGPIVLIETTTNDGVHVKSRLDLQKVMFIDPLPGERSASSIHTLVNAVVAATRQFRAL